MSLIAIIAATFVSEDLTCIGVGLLIHQGHVSATAGLLGCFLGIFLGDLGLWLLGRLVGRQVIEARWVQRRLPPQRLAGLARWFERHAWAAVLAARFVPGTRFPTYVGAGMLGRRGSRFALWALAAALLWTPVLVGLVIGLGAVVIEPLKAALASAWLVIPAAALLILLLVRLVEAMVTEIGRARFAASVSRLWRWEFWPMWLFYLPLLPYVAWLALRHGGLTTVTAANPCMSHGGIVGESKYDTLRRLPEASIVPTELLPPGSIEERRARLERVVGERGWSFPLILKPDASQRGAGLKLVQSIDDAVEHMAAHPDALLVQVYHPGPFEAGVFYYRMPDSPAAPDGRPPSPAGRIFSITDKRFPEVCGDGRSTVEQLIWRHPRLRMQANTFLARLNGQAEDVLATGRTLRLAVAGNHCQGTLFCDGAHLITPQLALAIDALARRIEGFYFGRFDVRYGEVAALRAGRGFAVIELNGATSESTNIYDPSWSLWRAQRVLREQWRILFEIGAANRARGVAATPLRELIRVVRTYYRDRRVRSLSD
jgi:membrane protein DedA with SNARE-associated domain